VAAPSSLVASHPTLGPLLTERHQRAKLLEAMVQTVAEKGFAAATVADAVRLARVSRGTFYALFESKEACLAAAYQLGNEVLEERVTAAVREAQTWEEELRLGLRAYLRTLDEEPTFARVYLLEWPAIGAARDAAMWRFAKRYGKTFARSPHPVPPDDALFILAAGVHELARSWVRAGRPLAGLEDTLVTTALRFAGEETRWT
jgi:AcrR family transcriptional regulator